MDDVIELTGSGTEHEILTQTSAGGLFGGELLNDDPLSSYLGDGEQPRYVARNRKAGLEVTRETGTETISPDGEYQALLLVTDLHVVCVVGRDGGDSVERLRLDEVFEARATNRRLRKNTLELETHDGLSWRFPCRGDPEPIAATINDVAQTWVYLEGVLADVETALNECERTLSADYASARKRLDEAEANLRTVSQQVDSLSETARTDIEAVARTAVDRLVRLRRELVAAEGARAHAQALEAWHDGAYETAVTRYGESIDAYETALGLSGTTPTDEQLTRRLDGATTERALVRIWPLVEADSERRYAVESEPEAAAQHWPQVFTNYVALLGLADSAMFDIDRDRLHEQMTAVADEAIADHYETGTRRLERGDECIRAEEDEQGQKHYAAARTQFEQARDIAENARERYLDSVETALYTVERRIEGEVPDETAEPVVPPLDESDDTESSSTGPAVPRSASQGPGLVGDGSEPRSVIERIKAQKTNNTAAAAEAGDQTDADEEVGGDDHDDENDEADDDTADKTGPEPDDCDADCDTEDETSTETADRADPQTNGETADETDDSPTGGAVEEATDESNGEVSNAETDEQGEEQTDVQAALRRLDDERFTELVTDLLEAGGWSTRVFSTAGRGTYDIVATRDQPAERRQLVWAVHRPDGGELGATLVRRAATARETNPQTDGVTLVTTGSLLPSAQQRADELDVTVIDGETLKEQITATDTVDVLSRLRE